MRWPPLLIRKTAPRPQCSTTGDHHQWLRRHKTSTRRRNVCRGHQLLPVLRVGHPSDRCWLTDACCHEATWRETTAAASGEWRARQLFKATFGSRLAHCCHASWLVCMMSELRNLGCLPSVANGGWQATYLFLCWYLSLNGSTMT